MNTWISHYQNIFKPHLDVNVSFSKRGLTPGLYHRGNGFEIVFKELLSIKPNNFLIIETGSTRKPNNWKDGNSGFIFADFVKFHGGFVRSVDIDLEAVESANQYIDKKYHQSYCADSVMWLRDQPDLNLVDLFYLDSMNVKWNNDSGSATHHLNEFLEIEKFLKPGAIVAIDDNSTFEDSKRRTGKGRLIIEYLEKKNKFPIYDAHQVIDKF